ncbi:MAG: NAD-dependent epimerase/dehydratase family protein, partial [Planctomycetota bacterium]|nr:NAD-dependent epimerase/dehydratase family protein [Planctomycetota bacterium]
MNVLITGGTGFIGRNLIRFLAGRGDRVSVVSRRPASVGGLPEGCNAVGWLPDLSDYDAIINLAGEPLIGKRWNEGQRQRILDSRIESTDRIVEALSQASPKPRVLVNASAIGIYGDRQDDLLREGSKPASDFVGQVCTRWEQAAARAGEHGVRIASIRIGLVLGMGGGALQKMLRPFQLGLGGPLGSGRQ